MKSWQASQFGDAQAVLQLQEVALPEPGEGQARVKVLLASIGLPDKLALEGKYPFVTKPPVTPGQEFVGLVDKAGPGFPFPIGTKILGSSQRYGEGYGAAAAYTICATNSVFPFPTELSPEQAVAFPGTYHVAYVGLVNRAAIQPQETLLVLGAAGRTGTAAVQLGKALGATVIAVIRKDEQRDFCLAQGADYVVNSSEEGLGEKLLQLTNQRGVDVIYDTVGGEAHQAVIQSIAYRGRLVLVGFAGGDWPTLNPLHIMFKGYAVMGALHTARTEEEKQEAIATLGQLVRAGKLAPPQAKLFAFENTVQAVTEVGSSSARGGIAVQVNEEAEQG
jgi:NADPH2:quinone reductase